MTAHVRFWLWFVGLRICDGMPWKDGPIPWCNVWHGGIVYRNALPDDDPCWQRAGFG